MTKSIFGKFLGGASVFINEVVEKGLGTERIEKASLNEIKSNLNELDIEQKNYQATYNILSSDLDTLNQKILELTGIRDSNLANFSKTQDEKYRQNGIKAIEMIKKSEAERDTKKEELNAHKQNLDAIIEASSKLKAIYNERLKQHEDAVSRSNIAQSTSKAADLIQDVSSYTTSSGNSKFADEARHKEEVAKLKIAEVTKGDEDNVDDFIKQSKNEVQVSSAEDEFNKLLNKQ